MTSYKRSKTSTKVYSIKFIKYSTTSRRFYAKGTSLEVTKRKARHRIESQHKVPLCIRQNKSLTMSSANSVSVEYYFKCSLFLIVLRSISLLMIKWQSYSPSFSVSHESLNTYPCLCYISFYSSVVHCFSMSNILFTWLPPFAAKGPCSALPLSSEPSICPEGASSPFLTRTCRSCTSSSPSASVQFIFQLIAAQSNPHPSEILAIKSLMQILSILSNLKTPHSPSWESLKPQKSIFQPQHVQFHYQSSLMSIIESMFFLIHFLPRIHSCTFNCNLQQTLKFKLHILTIFLKYMVFLFIFTLFHNQQY